MKKKILSVLKYIFFLAVGVILFWLALRGKDINKSLAEIKNADYTWISITLAVMLLSHVVRALRWNQLLNTLNIRTRTHTTFYSVMIGYFVNNAVPRLGEITRCGVLARHHKVPVNSVIGTVIAERAFDIVTMFAILIIVILTQIHFLGDFFYGNILGPIVSRFSDSTSALFVIGGGAIGICIILIVIYRLMLPRLRRLKIFHKILDLVKGFWHGIKTIKYIKQKKLFLFNTVLLWGLYTLTNYLCFQSMDATRHLTFVDALTLMSLGSIGTLVPTPGGIGAYQYFVTLTLIALYSIEKNTATAFANLIYFSQWIMINVVGSISWTILFLSDRKKTAATT